MEKDKEQRELLARGEMMRLNNITEHIVLKC